MNDKLSKDQIMQVSNKAGEMLHEYIFQILYQSNEGNYTEAIELTNELIETCYIWKKDLEQKRDELW